jgi:hypothetical protein
LASTGAVFELSSLEGSAWAAAGVAGFALSAESSFSAAAACPESSDSSANAATGNPRLRLRVRTSNPIAQKRIMVDSSETSWKNAAHPREA